MNARTNDERGGRRRTGRGVLSMLAAVVVAALLGGGGTMAVFNRQASGGEKSNRDEEIDRRLKALEEHGGEVDKSLQDTRETMRGVAKDVEWLVRDRGGTPAVKP